MKNRLIIIGADFSANALVGQIETEYQLLTDIASVDVPRGTIEISVESYMATYNDDVFIGSTPADITATADGGLTCTVGEPTGNIYPITIDGSAATSEECTITVTQPASNKVITIPATAIAYAIKSSTNASVMAVCYAQGWAANADYMTFDEAAAVTSIGEKFRGNTEIITFDEFQYFTGIKTIVAYAFDQCTALKRIIIPTNVTTMEGRVFLGCTALEYIRVPYKLVGFGGYAIFNNTPQRIVDTEDGWLTNYLINGVAGNTGSSPFAGGKGELYVNGVRQGIIVVDDSVTELKDNILIGLIADSLTLGIGITTLGSRSLWTVNIGTVVLGANVTSIGTYAFDMATINALICNATTPPTLASAFGSGVTAIYVPDASVDTYKAATNWSSSASKIFPLSQKP